ncbi:MAG TPA: hypothetical protein VED59_04295, partial [Acidimicrobiales bacterium]|nr:hypothetical protein [Acidimicrobiales bacterium]
GDPLSGLLKRARVFSPTQRRRPLPTGPVARDRFSALLHAISSAYRFTVFGGIPNVHRAGPMLAPRRHM